MDSHSTKFKEYVHFLHDNKKVVLKRVALSELTIQHCYGLCGRWKTGRGDGCKGVIGITQVFYQYVQESFFWG